MQIAYPPIAKTKAFWLKVSEMHSKHICDNGLFYAYSSIFHMGLTHITFVMFSNPKDTFFEKNSQKPLFFYYNSHTAICFSLTPYIGKRKKPLKTYDFKKVFSQKINCLLSIQSPAYVLQTILFVFYCSTAPAFCIYRNTLIWRFLHHTIAIQIYT